MSRLIDMTGWIMKEHGVPDSRLTVLKEDKDYKIKNNISQREAYWTCVCDCGNTITLQGSSIRSGRTRSCGCLYQDLGKSRRIKMIGKNFGLLTVIEEDNCYKEEKKNKKYKSILEMLMRMWILYYCKWGQFKKWAFKKLWLPYIFR